MIPAFGACLQGPDSAFFRVWAPNAKAVRVYGEFCGWQETQAVPLTPRPEGFWEQTVPGVYPKSKYEYLITKQDDQVKHRLDPAARDTDDSNLDNRVNKSRVVDTAWPWIPFTAPAFDDLIIYQCHVGSFSGFNDHLPTRTKHNRHRTRQIEVASFRNMETKLDYIRDLGFNAVALLPVQEFRLDRSWGYNPSFYFAIETGYGRPKDLRRLVDLCHQKGLAVIFDVVYNHISNDDNSFYHFDEAVADDHDSYLGSHQTPWGPAPAFWKQPIKDFFLANMAMYLQEYNGDGLRFDSTRAMDDAKGLDADGWRFMQYLTYMGKQLFPGKYFIAEHLPDHDTIIDSAGFHATWNDEPYDLLRRALGGDNPVGNIQALLDNDFGYGRSYSFTWNIVKYLLGSHDKCGDMDNGTKGHRYFVEFFGGRENWYARAKARMAWALNAAILGTPMMFMGGECHMWGYWHDGADDNGDHRFNWDIAGDWMGMQMRYLVTAANQARMAHPALRSGPLEVTHTNQPGIVAFKRWNDSGDIVLVVVNASDAEFTDYSYGVHTGRDGQWRQVLCTQDAWFGGWDGAGNAFHDPWTQPDGRIYINIPKWSVTIFEHS